MMFQAFMGKLIAPLYVLLSPFVSALAFLGAVILAIACICRDVRRKEPWIYFATMAFIVLFGLYTAFNIYDYLNYRRYGLAKSPINEVSYFLFFPPRMICIDHMRSSLCLKQHANMSWNSSIDMEVNRKLY